jgi:hypothetical protein
LGSTEFPTAEMFLKKAHSKEWAFLLFKFGDSSQTSRWSISSGFASEWQMMAKKTDRFFLFSFILGTLFGFFPDVLLMAEKTLGNSQVRELTNPLNLPFPVNLMMAVVWIALILYLPAFVF